MQCKRVKFQLVETWYDQSRYMAIKCLYTKKAGLMLWFMVWFLENYERYTLVRLPGAYANSKKMDKVLSLDLGKLAEVTKISRKMGYYKPTDVINWMFYNIKNIIEIQEQIESSKIEEGNHEK